MSGFGYNVLGFGANASGAAGDPVDDQFNRVSFLSHFDGSNNGVNNSFDDGSANNYTVTDAGNITQGSFGPFARPDGEWGVSFDGDSDYLQVAASSDFDFGTGDFTFECFFFKRDVGSYEYLVTFGNNSGSTSSIGLYIDDDLLGVYNNAAISSSTTINLNQWYHVAVVRISSTLKIYLDGSETKSATVSSDISSPGGMNVANWRLASDGQYFNGVISNVRVVKGTGVYTGNFTAPTSKLTAITNTKLLTCQSNRFVDNSATGHTVTPYVTSAVTAFGPFLTSAVYDPTVNGASAYLALGDSDYLQMPAQTIPTGSFTLEGWYYMTGSGAGQTVISQGSSGSSTRTFFGMEGNEFTFQMGGTVERGPTIFRNSWNYFACVYNSSYPFIQGWHNGVSTGATGYSGGNAENVAMQIGTLGSNWGSGYGLTGYVADIRVSSGIKYTANNITVPTSPLAVQDSNTKLLLNMKDAQAIDSAAQNNMTLFGNAKLSTGQAKFGDTSLLLDGTGDFVHLPNRPNLAGPFCIETWARADDTGNAFLWCLGQYRLELGINGNTLRIYRIGTSTGYTNFFTGGEFSANNWHHVALVRDTSNVIKCYLNGTASSTTVTDATAFVATNNIFIIGGESSGAPSGGAISLGWDGYVDDFRISDFARYTSNFTAPAKPFADKGQ